MKAYNIGLINNLKLYLCGSESIAGFGSNYTTCVQVIENHAGIDWKKFCWDIKLNTHVNATDGVYHDARIDQMENIKRIKQARRVYQHCQPNLQNRLSLIWYDCPGKITQWTREYMSYSYNQMWFDITALFCLVNNILPAELEKLTRDASKKKELTNKIKLTREVLHATLEEYLNEYQKQ